MRYLPHYSLPASRSFSYKFSKILSVYAMVVLSIFYRKQRKYSLNKAFNCDIVNLKKIKIEEEPRNLLLLSGKQNQSI